MDPLSLTVQLRSGQPGGRALRQALSHHLPQLAHTVNEFECAFLRDQRLIVELDGHATHANPPANEADRRRELRLRAAGYRVVRYTWLQVTTRPGEVVADLRLQLAARAV